MTAPSPVRASKYAPLAEHLRMSGLTHVPMTFAKIEELCGAPLPPSARRHRAWWSNNPSNSVITHAWLDAGYRSADVDMEGERLVFRRAESPGTGRLDEGGDDRPDRPATRQGDHPLWAALAGTVRIRPGVDLASPTAPEWEDEALAKFDRRAGPS
jgi:hypothetical protein